MDLPLKSHRVLSGIAIALLPAMLVAQTISPAAPPPQSAAPKSPWTYSASMAVKESFDSNVLLQDEGDQAKRESWVTSLLPALGVVYQKSPALKASVSYSPEVVFYHSESSEDHVTHRGMINFGGRVQNTAWELLNGVTWIDGSNLGPRFTSGGGTSAAELPAIGAVPLRDRRDATIYRTSFKLTQTMDKFFLRPVFTSYVHDFQTEQHVSTGDYLGYENYIDRYDIGGGVDGGYEIAPKTWLVLGYRFGHQEQMKNQFGNSSPYGNNYHRFLIGIEGTPTDWMRLNVLAGPDVRDWQSATPAGFDRNELLYFVDASVSLMPTKLDTLTLAARRYAQPGFASHSVYEDIVYEISYRRKLNDRFAAGAGFKIYEGDWLKPVLRDDWIFTPSAVFIYTHDKHISGELAYSYDWVDAQVSGREFTRHLVSLGVKYSF